MKQISLTLILFTSFFLNVFSQTAEVNLKEVNGKSISPGAKRSYQVTVTGPSNGKFYYAWFTNHGTISVDRLQGNFGDTFLSLTDNHINVRWEDECGINDLASLEIYITTKKIKNITEYNNLNPQERVGNDLIFASFNTGPCTPLINECMIKQQKVNSIIEAFNGSPRTSEQLSLLANTTTIPEFIIAQEIISKEELKDKLCLTLLR